MQKLAINMHSHGNSLEKYILLLIKCIYVLLLISVFSLRILTQGKLWYFDK